MTINPHTNQYRNPDPGRRMPHTTKAIIIVAVLVAIGGILYTFATGDRNHQDALNPPPTTTGSSSGSTAANSGTPATTVPAGSGTQRP
jgi:hypothetical protein